MVRYRRATRGDIEGIASLHAESWRRNYRGAFADAFLDGDLLADRLMVWTERLIQPQPRPSCTIVAERDDALVGFAHTVLDEDPTWGALLDNLHVDHRAAGHGVGTRLMGTTAAAVLAEGSSPRLYLWVLEQNHGAQAFYEARGGSCAGREPFEPPGGGTAVGLRYVWQDVSTLLTPAAIRPIEVAHEGPDSRIAGRRGQT